MKLCETNSIELFKEAHILTRPRLRENIHRQFMYSLCGLFVHVCNCYICVSLVAICNLLRPVVSVTTNQYSTLQLIMIYHLRLYFDAHFWQPIIIEYCRSFFVQYLKLIVVWIWYPNQLKCYHKFCIISINYFEWFEDMCIMIDEKIIKNCEIFMFIRVWSMLF